MNYTFVLPVDAFPLGNGRFALESAFAEHLRELLRLHSPMFSRITLVGPTMPVADYEERGAYLKELDATADGIRFVGLHEYDAPYASFLRAAPSIREKLHAVIRDADLVQGTYSHVVFRPVEFYALMLASKLGKKTIGITDIDNREAARMLHASGNWSRKAYLANHLAYDPIRAWQQRRIVARCSLVLLKGQKLVDDFGRGLPHVKFFQDTAYSASQVIDPEELDARCEAVARSREPLKLTHFGRLEFYKGMHHAIEAVARANGAAKLTLIGTGTEERALRELVARLRVQDSVEFVPPMSYGDAFLNRVREQDLLIAPSLAPDTPRSAWDAIASGLPILAYDTEYYAQLRDKTGAVATVAWGDIQALANAVEGFANDRRKVEAMKRGTREVALDNTQERWIARRVAWTEALFE